MGENRRTLMWTNLLCIVALLRDRHDTLGEDFNIFVRMGLMILNQRELSHMVCALTWLGAGHEETLRADALTFFQECSTPAAAGPPRASASTTSSTLFSHESVLVALRAFVPTRLHHSKAHGIANVVCGLRLVDSYGEPILPAGCAHFPPFL